jgi:hypothetical protein
MNARRGKRDRQNVWVGPGTSDGDRNRDPVLARKRAFVDPCHNGASGHETGNIRLREGHCRRQRLAIGPLGVDELNGPELAKNHDLVAPLDKPFRFLVKCGEVVADQRGRGREPAELGSLPGQFAVDHERDVASQLHRISFESGALGCCIAGQQKSSKGQQRDENGRDQPEQIHARGYAVRRGRAWRLVTRLNHSGSPLTTSAI